MQEKPLTFQLSILAVILAGLFLVFGSVEPLATDAPATTVATSTQVSASATALDSKATSSPEAIDHGEGQISNAGKRPSGPVPVAPSSTTTSNQIRRIEHPYSTDPLKFEAVNAIGRSALVNIFCSSDNGILRPISGSGVFIDPRGVILTNAHVAQYVLLAQSGTVNLGCEIRTGSPAVAKWEPLVMYIPPIWVREHAADLTKDRPVGTGKHDYALLYAGAPVGNAPRPSSFPYVSPDTREAIGFVDDEVLAASYPAEFLGPITSSFNMYQVTSISRIDELYTLGSSTVDVMSIGSVIGAQSGSSGGAIVNAWARLVGIITTTSEGVTTGERRLRGITLSYIDHDIFLQTGRSLSAFLDSDPLERVYEFISGPAPSLVELLLAQLK